MSKIRHQVNRWQILYGSFNGVSATAVSELQKSLQSFMPYVIETVPAALLNKDRHLCIVGCLSDNPLLRELAEKGLLPEPKKAQGFSLATCASPWNPERKLIAVAGFDAAGLLYGIQHLNAHLLPRYVSPLRGEDCRTALEKLPDLRIEESPLIENRGIWSWGYVVYDYRKFIDKMARLRMNMITLWHDEPPINSPEFIAYAHSRGISVIYGFAWGWGLDELDLSSADDRRRIKEDVIARYRRDYAHLDLDGIYFQTLTEHNKETINGQSTASLACRLVNETSAELLKINPSLYIQFGLHASSIRENYKDLLPLHPQVTIAWEDAGGIPYTYSLEESPDGPSYAASKVAGVKSVSETAAYSKRLAAFRGHDTEFAFVPKGWCSIDWTNEFENHGPYIMGEQGRSSQIRNFEKRRAHWQRVNQSWFRLYPEAAGFYRELRAAHKGAITATGLVEDGLFELAIQPSVALFAETLWNPGLSNEEILCRAMSPYYYQD
ncbi:MAG: hypothetical protein A2X49_00130 [Lentisphaerae bacterium GWF2_52_8]|nr:MAG: hypothetical protein A2X49_00130 [Lentisphaerae bacterium GWF2_52_8]